jgi:intergrase/recombinase
MADKALAEGSADHMIKELGGHMAKAVREKFNKALEAKKNKDKSVEAGREFVEAYVVYVHYVEGIHAAIVAAGGHHHASVTTRATLATSEHREHKD